MARKTLLTEAELRSFMKLAELRPLSDSRVQEIYGDDDDREPKGPNGESLEEEVPPMADEPEMGMEDPEMGMEDPEMDMGADMESGAKMVPIDDFMSALETALEDILGEPVSTEIDDEMADEDALEDEEALDVAAEVEPEMGPEMAPDDEEEVPGMRDGVYENQEELVNEVARRVAKRLQSLDKKANVVDTLAEKIMQRLTQ